MENEALCEQLRWKGLLEVGLTPQPSTWTPVSIVIPSYNRARQLKRCLYSLFALDYPHREIIVVDDASTDETWDMLVHMAEEATAQGLDMRVIRHKQRQGAGVSRNTGTKVAQYDLIAYIDSDCVASPEWLQELVPAFQDVRIAAVGGMLRAYERRTMLGRYEDVRSSLFMGVRPQQVLLEGPLTYLPTANLLVRRSIWQKLSGFAPLPQGEDVDFCRRLLLSGANMQYLPQGIVYHDYRTTMRAFLRIRADYASAEAALLQRYPADRGVLVLPPEQAMFAGMVIGGGWSLMNQALDALGKPRGNGYALYRNGFWRMESKYRVGAGAAGMLGEGRCGRPRGQKNGSLHMRNDRRQWCPIHEARRAATRAPTPLHSTPAPTRYAFSIPKNRPLQTGPRPYANTLSIGWCMALLALILTLFGTRQRLQKVRKQNISLNPLTVFKATLRGHLAYTYHLCRHLTRYYTLPLLAIGLLLPPLMLLAFLLCGIVIATDYVRLRPDMGLGEYALCSLLDDCAYEIGVVRGCVKHRTWKPLLPTIKKKAS